MKIDIIIMASGLSKRFGSENKLEYLISGTPLIEITIKKAVGLKTLLPNIIGEILVVSCYDFVESLTTRYNVNYIYNSNNEEGISSTIKLGVINSNNSMLFMVSDMPYLNIYSLKYFILGYLNQDKKLGSIASFDGNLNNPCIFDRSYADLLLSLEKDNGGKKIIKKHLDDLYTYKVAQYQLLDIDYRK